jgi:hypothetical protein
MMKLAAELEASLREFVSAGVAELGGFRWYGYFPGVEIQDTPPLVYLALAPRFHPVSGIVLGALSPQIEVVRVGLTRELATRHPGGHASIIELRVGAV